MRSIRAIHAVGSVVITVAACVTACAMAAATGTASQGVVPTATPAASGSAMTSIAATPPAAVPDGFPAFPGAESVTAPPDSGLVARWIVDADGAEVYDFYVRALPAAGFVIEQRFPGGAAAVLRFSLPDGQLLDVSLTASGSGTQVDLRLPAPAP